MRNPVRIGEGTVDTSMTYRMGHGLYVADSFEIAKFFCAWDDPDAYPGQDTRVCEIWVRDYDVWLNLNKVWVAEHSRNLPLVDTRSEDAEATGMSQEIRDEIIQTNFGVYTPYVLFARHHYIDGMPPPRNTRWNEMVVYTQVYRALVDLVPMTDEMMKKVTNKRPYPFDKQFKTWKIVAPKETRDEFLKYREQDLYANSGN